jgi:hypothetical protein
MEAVGGCSCRQVRLGQQQGGREAGAGAGAGAGCSCRQEGGSATGGGLEVCYCAAGREETSYARQQYWRQCCSGVAGVRTPEAASVSLLQQ